MSSKTVYTTAFDATIKAGQESNCRFWFDRVGKFCFLSFIINMDSAVTANTQLGHIENLGSGMLIDNFVSVVGSNGTTIRLKMTTNGKVIVESVMPANEWFSASMVIYYNSPL